jgi:essential nuclear protein 1
VSGVLARVSIPVLHSAAAIKTLCDIAAEQASQNSECVSATNLLLRTLLEKKYALRRLKRGLDDEILLTREQHGSV